MKKLDIEDCDVEIVDIEIKKNDYEKCIVQLIKYLIEIDEGLFREDSTGQREAA